MRKVKIVADSSANLLTLERADFASAPLKVIAADREFVDDAQLDVDAMTDYFMKYKGTSNPQQKN